VPSPDILKITVSDRAARAVKQGEPWVFRKSVVHIENPGCESLTADIHSPDGVFLARGLYDPDALFTVRILSRGAKTDFDTAWFCKRIERARKIRQPLESEGTNGYRLIHGESDGLPGLVVDRYDKTFVMKVYCAAWLGLAGTLAEALELALGAENIVLRTDRGTAASAGAGAPLKNGAVLKGSGAPAVFSENGLLFEADPVSGQKTGFFLDQRENRARAGKLAAGKTVLNVFSHTGGFSVYAAAGGALKTVSLDISGKALEGAAANFRLNSGHPRVAACAHETMEGDAFELMKKMAGDKIKFGMVIIDPPSFAAKRADVREALTAYGRLARAGLRLLEDNGTLVASSCSPRVPADAFFRAVEGAAREFGRPLRIIEKTGHAADHPVKFKETAYLKCLLAEAPPRGPGNFSPGLSVTGVNSAVKNR
jgi:23S rRNA (cytosine1962-C5)-methyltransferase